MPGFPRRTGFWLLLVSLVVLFVILGAVVFSVLPQGRPAPAAQPSTIPTRIAVVTGTVAPPTATASVTPTATAVLTVTPLITTTPTVTPTAAATLTPTPPAVIVLEGITIPARKAAFLRNKDVWVAESGRGDQTVTSFGDVEAIFGWNKDATMLLFGRGRKQQGVHIGNTTELWLANLSSKTNKQLTTGSNVHTAAWSPVEDRIAYCEQDNILKIGNLDGKITHRLPNAMCYFNWSPDGSALAAVTITSDSIKESNLSQYDFLTIWQPTSGLLKVLNTDRGLIEEPIWSTDGRSIIFQLDQSGAPQSLWHLADVATGVVRRLNGTPKILADFVSRSPRADVLVFRVDQTIHIMDFDGKLQVLDTGRSPIWLPTGMTVIYRGRDDKLRIDQRDLASPNHVGVGGDFRARGLYSQPDYFLTQ